MSIDTGERFFLVTSFIRFPIIERSFLRSYNRYDAQECYCGEPNCVGFLGGKTQTDVGAMDDLYIDGQFESLPAYYEDEKNTKFPC